VEQVLVPELREGDVVIMDNLSSHCARRRRLSALPSALQLRIHPIENAFAKLKALLRRPRGEPSRALEHHRRAYRLVHLSRVRKLFRRRRIR